MPILLLCWCSACPKPLSTKERGEKGHWKAVWGGQGKVICGNGAVDILCPLPCFAPLGPFGLVPGNSWHRSEKTHWGPRCSVGKGQPNPAWTVCAVTRWLPLYPMQAERQLFPYPVSSPSSPCGGLSGNGNSILWQPLPLS